MITYIIKGDAHCTKQTLKIAKYYIYMYTNYI